MSWSPGNRPDVAKLRRKMGLTQQEFASLLGLATVSVSRWEHRHVTLTDTSSALVGLLARALAKTAPKDVVLRLREVMVEGEVARVVALVHLGD